MKNRAVKWTLQAPLRFWHRRISPLLPPMCRFEPTCSVYAIEAIEKHSPPRAARLIVWRLLRCQPFHPGGFDPVPDPPGARRPAGRRDGPSQPARRDHE